MPLLAFGLGIGLPLGLHLASNTKSAAKPDPAQKPDAGAPAASTASTALKYKYVEQNKNVAQTRGCQLPNAKFSLQTGAAASEVMALERECNERADCVGYYAEAANKGAWLISTNALPEKCIDKHPTQTFPYFWKKSEDA